MSPAFSPSRDGYQALVDGNVDQITVTPTVPDSSAKVTVNDMEVSNGSPSSPIALKPGSNSINVLVKAPDRTEKRYVVNLVRDIKPDLSGLTLSNGTLTPPFGTVGIRPSLSNIIIGTSSSWSGAPVTVTITDYTASVDNRVTSITVTPTAAYR
ncbi:cadherin-like beta sandwich domain-containing protein [Paenibacillus chartarius]